MPRTIRILPDGVANQIAAGEVVERPASVVKELVENALDAGARRIDVHLARGGKRTIRVADDGCGMGRGDAILSLDRHATSKVQRARDLRTIGTLGFRGEALPSIASVSRFTLETQTDEENSGTRIRVRGGTIMGVEDAARTRGTTVTAENLFYNAPARAAFLRTPPVETRAASEAISPLALAHPEVAFTLTSDDRTLLDLPRASGVVERIAALWGDAAARDLLRIEAESGGIRLRGLVQRPDATRPGFRRSCLFVAGRPFREPALVRAVDRGYRTTIPERNRPWLFLFLAVPAGSVDVNVHPTKAEVRFRDLPAVETLVERGVRAALETMASAATLDGNPARPVLTGEPSPSGAPGVPGGSGEGEGGGDGEGDPDPAASESDSQMALFVPVRDGPQPPAGEKAPEEGVPEYKPSRIWQVHRSWILAEVRDGLLLVDQHAAHERVLFERIMRRFDDGKHASQRLIFPLTIRLTRAEHSVVEDLAGLMGATGFQIEGFGGNTVIVHGVPEPHPGFDAERCLREMLAELADGSALMRSARNQFERVAMSFACKAAIKAGQALDRAEVEELFDQLFATELPYHDVHGRPTTVRLSRAELERKFGR